jgi:hypothetical protein
LRRCMYMHPQISCLLDGATHNADPTVIASERHALVPVVQAGDVTTVQPRIGSLTPMRAAKGRALAR